MKTNTTKAVQIVTPPRDWLWAYGLRILLKKDPAIPTGYADGCRLTQLVPRWFALQNAG